MVKTYVNKARQKEWIASVRRYRLGIDTRLKLGVFDTLIDKVSRQHRASGLWDCPDWSAYEHVVFVYICMVSNEYPIELLENLVRTASCDKTHGKPLSRDDVKATFERLIKRDLNRKLRTKFGVFDKDEDRI